MNQDKKTSSFLKAINKYAQQQSEEIKHEVEEFKKQEIEKATKEGISDAYKLIQKEIATKKSQIISDIAKRAQESRQKLFIKRNEIVDSVFADAKAKLLNYTSTEQYKEYLTKSANEIAEYFGDKNCVVYIKESDNDKVQLLKSIITNCSIEEDESIQIGGIKAYCENMSVMLDDTFDSKLENERVYFTESSNIKVV